MSRSLFLRMLENFFRRWYLYLLPIVLLGILGFLSVSGKKSEFRSVGTFNVESSTLLATLNGTQEAGFGYETPAGATSGRINAVLQTDQFVKDLAARAGVDLTNPMGMTILKVRTALSAFANGASLVQVAATTEDPTLAQKLAAAAIASYTQSVVDSQAGQSTAAVDFFNSQLTTHQEAIDGANAALNSYLATHPLSALGTRPPEEQSEISRLTATLAAAQDVYNTTISKRQDAQLSVEQVKADIGERLRLVDAPQVAQAPLSGKKAKLMGMVTFLGLGLLLTGGAVVAGTFLDHSLRSADEVRDKLNVRVLGVVPDAGRRWLRAAPKPAKAKKPKETKPPRLPAEKSAPTRGARPARPAAVKALPDRAARGTAARRGGRKPTTGRPVGKASGASGWPG